jgi:RimJ/RimL family protein N-acetyltransferase
MEGKPMETKSETHPKWVTWRDRLEMQIRPLKSGEVDSLVAWLRSLDERELAKLPCDVRDEGYSSRLHGELKDKSVHRLLAWKDGNEIVGSIALYPGSLHWVRHTGRLVVVTDPRVRRSGIAVVLLEEMIRLAEELKIRKLYAELTGAHREARRLAKTIGFKREATLRNHVIDSDGHFHDLHIYSMELEKARDVMAELLPNYVRIDNWI